MTTQNFKALDHAFNILDIAKATGTMLKAENIQTARGVIDLLPAHQRPAMKQVLGAISMGVIPRADLCDDAISALKKIAPGMYV